MLPSPKDCVAIAETITTNLTYKRPDIVPNEIEILINFIKHVANEGTDTDKEGLAAILYYAGKNMTYSHCYSEVSSNSLFSLSQYLIRLVSPLLDNVDFKDKRYEDVTERDTHEKDEEEKYFREHPAPIHRP